MPYPVDTEFFIPRLPINIAALTNAYEADAIRALLEMLGCVVTIHWIGTPTDFLKVLSQGETAPPYLLIAGHGDDENGYYFGEYAPFIDTSMLRNQHMPADVIAPVVNLPNCTVISTACWGGIESMGWVFTKNGEIKAYIGCRVAPFGDEMCVFVVNFFFNILRKKLSDREAWQKAMVSVDQPAIYQVSFFDSSSVEERYQEN
jgi:hypothetical protein